MARIFSGIQPSGELHIGNYLGAVKNWVTLQHTAESIFCIVDYHAITGAYDPRSSARAAARWRSACSRRGSIRRCPRCSCSRTCRNIPSSHGSSTRVTPLGELERQTQFKDKSQRQESVTAGLLNYPILQAADILLYRADRVPVGEDQVQHLELSRVIARRWNAEFSPDEDYFPEPKPLLTPTRRIMGLDGQAKMSKSMGNTIGLLETPEEIWAKLRPAVTDPKRIKRTDPGTPEVCNIYHLHKAFSPPATVEHVATQCSTAGWGCIDCKKVLAESMESELVPIRARAAALREDAAGVDAALAAGAAKCRAIARETMRGVRERMGFD